MFIYGKTAANAISVMSYLAALPKGHLADSQEIASSRGISRALAAKLLTQLAKKGLTEGRAGPGGGYRLGRPAKSISLMDIVILFEQTNSVSPCPFGKNWCGKNNPCPLHDTIDCMLKANHEFMTNTRLSLFSEPLSQPSNIPSSTHCRV
jgi:Rrf2 family protein